MPPRPTWKGFLKVSLVNIPVKVFPATESSESISFNQLHAECQTRIQQKRWCAHCEREVPNSELVKGYEFEKGRYVVIDDEDIQKVRVMYTLHHDAEIRSIDQIEELNSVPTKVKPEEMKLAKQVIATFDAELNLKDYKDEYKEGLRKIIDAKIAGEEIVAPEVAEPARVVDLMEALKRSLDSVSQDKKKPAKAELKKVAAAPKARAANGARKRKVS